MLAVEHRYVRDRLRAPRCFAVSDSLGFFFVGKLLELGNVIVSNPNDNKVVRNSLWPALHGRPTLYCSCRASQLRKLVIGWCAFIRLSTVNLTFDPNKKHTYTHTKEYTQVYASYSAWESSLKSLSVMSVLGNL